MSVQWSILSLYFRFVKFFGRTNRTLLKAVQSDIMGDINWLRQSIIHNKGVAKKKVEKCKILEWFKKGAEQLIHNQLLDKFVTELSVLSYLKQTVVQ